MHYHGCSIRLEPPGFDDCSGCSMEQLIPQVAGWSTLKAQKFADEVHPLDLALARVLHPIPDGRAKGLINFGLDSNGDRFRGVSDQGEDVALALSTAAGQCHLVFGDCQQQFRGVPQQLSNLGR